jgi:hypothetical protein
MLKYLYKKGLKIAVTDDIVEETTGELRHLIAGRLGRGKGVPYLLPFKGGMVDESTINIGRAQSSG